MAYEVVGGGPRRGARPPGTVITVSQSPPFGLRKLSVTLCAHPRPGYGATCRWDVGGHSGSSPRRSSRWPSALLRRGRPRPALVVASDHLVSYEDRGVDTLSAGAAAAFVVWCLPGGVARSRRL